MAEREIGYIPTTPASRLEMSALIVEQPESGDGAAKRYYTAVFDVGQSRSDWEGKKAHIPVVRVEYAPAQGPGKFQVELKIEDGYESHGIRLQDFEEARLLDLVQACNEFVARQKEHTPANGLAELASDLAREVERKFTTRTTETHAEVLPYLPYRPEQPVIADNLKDIVWLRENYNEEKDTDVDQRGERLLRIAIGGKEFEFLQSGDMYFVLNNVPTIEVMDAAIKAGVMSEKEKADFISLEQEMELKKKTLEQYKRKGEVKGAAKDLRGQWERAPANFEYDAVRRLYYLEIAGEPVMDEFERDYIELLGTNAARYDHAVLEIGFGMGISGNAIQEELAHQQELARAEGRTIKPTHIIIEFNHEVAEKTREWAMRQKVPVVVLEGDWKDMIKQIPDAILTGALADPYPLNPEEKHKDAALTLKEIHRCLRPGGVASIYADSQYALSADHAAIAQEAGYKYIGTATTEFAKRGKNTGEYYDAGLRMAMPVLYKDGGTGSAQRQTVSLDAQGTRELIEKLFIKNPRQFRERYQLTKAA